MYAIRSYYDFSAPGEDQQKLLAVMVVELLFLGPLGDGEEKRFHFLVALAEGEGFISVAVAGTGLRDHPADHPALPLAHHLVFALDLLLVEKDADFDVKEARQLGERGDGGGDVVVLDLRDQRRRETGLPRHILQSELARLSYNFV